MNNQTKVVEKIRNQYIAKETNKLDQLRELDRRVKTPITVFAYLWGTISALVLGTGMSLAMEVIGDNMLLGIIFGCIGIIMVSFNYAIYRKGLISRRRKYSTQILDVSNELINGTQKVKE